MEEKKDTKGTLPEEDYIYIMNQVVRCPEGVKALMEVYEFDKIDNEEDALQLIEKFNKAFVEGIILTEELTKKVDDFCSKWSIRRNKVVK